MNNRPFFSITTPCFNSEKTIERTLRSVLEQEFKDYEYIIVDGGSTDGTTDILKRYEPLFEGRMRWKSERDKGIYDAFNKGIAQSKGLYCWNINADDYAEPQALQFIADKVKDLQPSSFPILSGSLRFIYDDGREAHIKTMDQKEADRRYRLADIGINHPATIVPKRVYDQVGSYDEQYKIMGDMDWFRRAYEAGVPFMYTAEVLTNMSEGGVSTKLNFSKLARDRWHYSRKFYSNILTQSWAFCRWMLMHQKGHLKHILTKRGLMK